MTFLPIGGLDLRLRVYTAYNHRTDGVVLHITNEHETHNQTHINDNCDKRYLHTTLSMFDEHLVSILPHYATQCDTISISVHSFGNENLRDCINRITTTLDRIKHMDKRIQQRFIDRSLRKKNGTKLATYDVLFSIITKLNEVNTHCQFTLTHEYTNDETSQVCWVLLK